MKKRGFTLAEVLITLGIVGVVSALVLPTFTTRMQTAKVGPRLAKAVAGFEQANIAILDDAQSDSLSGTDLLSDADDYFGTSGLQTHMKGSYDTTKKKFYSADGAAYCLVAANGRTPTVPTLSNGVIGSCGGGFVNNVTGSTAPHLTRISAGALMIDIDGDNGPNASGRDLFFFEMEDDGSLRPWGGSWDNGNVWSTTGNCERNAKAGNPALCAGHVMENGLKVEYK